MDHVWLPLSRERLPDCEPAGNPALQDVAELSSEISTQFGITTVSPDPIDRSILEHGNPPKQAVVSERLGFGPRGCPRYI